MALHDPAHEVADLRTAVRIHELVLDRPRARREQRPDRVRAARSLAHPRTRADDGERVEALRRGHEHAVARGEHAVGAGQSGLGATQAGKRGGGRTHS